MDYNEIEKALKKSMCIGRPMNVATGRFMNDKEYKRYLQDIFDNFKKLLNEEQKKQANE